jgi:ABC-type uncharacterized transport system permease subunit
MSGVSIICFASSYAIVLAMEISRLVFRSGIRGAMMLGWAAAGMIAHTAFLYYQAVRAPSPFLFSWQEWFLAAAWVLMAVYFYLMFYHPRTYFGVFLLPLVLGLIATAWWVASPKPFAREPASQAWGLVHAVSLALAAVALLVGLAAGLMYLRQDRRLKQKITADRGLRLPSLEWLHAAAGRTQVIAALMLGLGIVSGMILNAIRHPPGDAIPWSDPIILCTGLTLLWLVVILMAGLFCKPLRQGRNVACLAIFSFLLFFSALAAGLKLGTRHGGSNTPTAGSARRMKRVQTPEYAVRSLPTAHGPRPTFPQPTEAKSHVFSSRRL